MVILNFPDDKITGTDIKLDDNLKTGEVTEKKLKFRNISQEEKRNIALEAIELVENQNCQSNAKIEKAIKEGRLKKLDLDTTGFYFQRGNPFSKALLTYNQNTHEFIILNPLPENVTEDNQEIRKTDQMNETVAKIVEKADFEPNLPNSSDLLQKQVENSINNQAMNDIVVSLLDEKLEEARQQLKCFKHVVDKRNKKKSNENSRSLATENQTTTDLPKEQDQETKLNPLMTIKPTNIEQLVQGTTNVELPSDKDSARTSVETDKSIPSTSQVMPEEDSSAGLKKEDIYEKLSFTLFRKISDDLKEQLDRSYGELQTVHKNFRNTIETFDTLLTQLSKM